MKLPTYDSSNAELKVALNTMARAIEAVELRSTITSNGNIKCTQDSSGISLYHTDDHVYGSTNTINKNRVTFSLYVYCVVICSNPLKGYDSNIYYISHCKFDTL